MACRSLRAAFALALCAVLLSQQTTGADSGYIHKPISQTPPSATVTHHPPPPAGTVAPGGYCSYDTQHTPVAPYCKGDPFRCVVTTVVKAGKTFTFKGTCANHTVLGGPAVCQYQSVAFAVGTIGIPDNANCETCKCVAGKPNASCVCNPDIPCQVDSLSGKPKGAACPSVQSTCFVSKINSNPQLPSSGLCESQGYGYAPHYCVSAGPAWGPVFIAAGTVGAKKPGELCSNCTCKGEGTYANCKTIPGCKSCQLPKSKTPQQTCTACCSGATDAFYRAQCLKGCLATQSS